MGCTRAERRHQNIRQLRAVRRDCGARRNPDEYDETLGGEAPRERTVMEVRPVERAVQ